MTKTKNLIVKKAFAVGILSASVFLTMPIPISFAQDSQVQDVSTQSIEGKIIKKEDNTLFIESSDGTVRQYSVPDGVSIQKNTQSSSVSDLSVNDRVTVKSSDSGAVMSIEATSGQIFDMSKIAIPLLVGSLALITVLMIAKSKVNRPRIKTA